MTVTTNPQTATITVPNGEAKVTIQAGDYGIAATPQIASMSATPGTAKISVLPQIARSYENADPYTGEYTVTPTQETQTLPTHNKRMTADLIVNPIPSNYGLITWNGSILTVS